MDILKLEKGIVGISDDGMDIPEIRDFYASDKRPDKQKFKYYMKALYYIHSKQSPYYGMEYLDRIQIVENKHIGKRKWRDMQKVAEFQSVIEVYKNIVEDAKTRKTKDILHKLNNDLSANIDELQNIPLRKKQKVRIPVPDPETGEEIMRDVVVDVLNTKERLEAQEAIRKMLKFQDELEDRLKDSNRQTVVKDYVPLFNEPD